MKRHYVIVILCLITSGLIYSTPSDAVGINTNVALPVAKGHFILRSQVRYSRVTDDPTDAGRRLHLLQFPQVLVYGATSKLALFGIFPVVYRDANFAGPNQMAGIGDFTILSRYEIFKRDWIHRTFRLALFGGLEIPSGDSPFSSNSIDIPLGVVTTFQTHRQEVDLDLRYKVNTEGNGVDHGDALIHNLAYQVRILPWRLPETGVPNQLNLVAEANGTFTQSNAMTGTAVPNTGGYTLFLSPGIQYVMKRLILEASVQIPVVQNLNGNQLETTLRVNGGARVYF